MTNIILCGNLSDNSISCALIPALARYGGVRYSSPKQIYERGVSAEFFLYDCENIPEIKLKSGIVLFKNSINMQTHVSIPANFLCVIETKNVRAAAMLQSTKAAAITCGTGSKDTLSIAGLENVGATLSLQRNLKTLNGNVLEPHDFNVKFSEKRSPHQLLSTCAVLLASGSDSNKGFVI